MYKLKNKINSIPVILTVLLFVCSTATALYGSNDNPLFIIGDKSNQYFTFSVTPVGDFTPYNGIFLPKDYPMTKDNAYTFTYEGLPVSFCVGLSHGDCNIPTLEITNNKTSEWTDFLSFECYKDNLRLKPTEYSIIWDGPSLKKTLDDRVNKIGLDAIQYGEKTGRYFHLKLTGNTLEYLPSGVYKIVANWNNAGIGEYIPNSIETVFWIHPVKTRIEQFWFHMLKARKHTELNRKCEEYMKALESDPGFVKKSNKEIVSSSGPVNPKSTSFIVHNELATVYEKLGNYKKAFEHYEEIIKIYPNLLDQSSELPGLSFADKYNEVKRKVNMESKGK